MQKTTHLRFALFTASFMLMLFSLVTIQSCQKDKCQNVHCSNGGACNDGKCTCKTGFEGQYCQTKANEKFQGTYIGTDCGDAASWTIQAMSDPQTIGLTVPGTNTTFTGTISGNSISFADKPFYVDTDKFSFSGNGSLSGNSLTVNYHIIDYTNSDSWNCSFTGSK